MKIKVLNSIYYWLLTTPDTIFHHISIYILFVYPFLRIHILHHLTLLQASPGSWRPPHRLRLCLLGHTKDQARGLRSARRLHRTGRGRHRRLSTLGSNRRWKWDPIGSNPSIGAKHRSIGATRFSRTRSALTLIYRRKNIRNMCIYIYMMYMHAYVYVMLTGVSYMFISFKRMQKAWSYNILWQPPLEMEMDDAAQCGPMIFKGGAYVQSVWGAQRNWKACHLHPAASWKGFGELCTRPSMPRLNWKAAKRLLI